jgi:hypothetical protein
MKIQLATIVSAETREAYRRLSESTGLGLTDLLAAAVPLLERNFQRAGLVAGYIQLARWGDLDPTAHCPECDQPFGDLPWIAIRANGATDAPICSRCATSE